MIRLLWIGSVAALILGQVAMLRAQDEPEPKKESVRAFSLRVDGEGHVEMTVKENGGEKTYRADSMEAFLRVHPDLARQYGIGRAGMSSRTFQVPGAFSKKFDEWRQKFGDLEPWNQDPELQKFLEHPEQLFEERGLPRAERQAPAGPRLGVRLAPLSQVLADQLGLEAKSGSLIDDVEPGSLAEKAGLKKNDVLVKVDGKDASGLDSIRAAVGDALKKKDFDVEILRQGKKQALRVQVPAQK